MAQDEAPEGVEDAGAKGGRKRPLAIGAALMALCGAGAFAAVSMGLVPGLGGGGAEAAEGRAEAAAQGHGEAAGGNHGSEDATAAAFVPVEPMTVTLGSGAGRSHLRLTSQIEVAPGAGEAVAAVMPRILDVLGGYLRALDPAQVEERDALVRLRSQMLRRVRLVAGEDAVKDLLVTEFVIN